jgi:hypothetical protein
MTMLEYLHQVQHDLSITSKVSLDVGVAAGGLTYPIWSAVFDSGLQWFALVGGAVLLVLRLWLVILELRQKRRDREED